MRFDRVYQFKYSFLLLMRLSLLLGPGCVVVAACVDTQGGICKSETCPVRGNRTYTDLFYKAGRTNRTCSKKCDLSSDVTLKHYFYSFGCRPWTTKLLEEENRGRC
jgi:hypothetical protein